MPSVPSSGSTPPPSPAWNAAPEGQPTGYGGFWIRVVAYFIDGIMLNIALWIIALVIGINLLPDNPDDIEPFALAKDVGRFQLAALIVTWLYFALMESSARGATLGKMACGLRVVDARGDRISFGRASGRFFAKILSSMLLGIGYLMVAFTQRKQGLHDIIAGTLVVKIH